MAPQLTDGIVRILGPDNSTVGTGFVVRNDGLIITCAHVVNAAKAGPGDTVALAFHVAKTKERRTAVVEARYWRDDTDEDIAILRLKENLPERVIPLPLGSSVHSRDHNFSTFGFSSLDALDGMWGTGEVLGTKPQGGFSVLQLRSEEVTQGFSGAPIWDNVSQVVIGMVISSMTNREIKIKTAYKEMKVETPMFTTPADPNWRFLYTAFARPTETLREVCPELQVSNECPYRQLIAFAETDARFFYGRDDLVETLLTRLHDISRFLAIFGPSGSGKSSVVRAGLIPKLREGAILDSQNWEVYITRPADDPFKLLVETPLTIIDNLTQRVSTWLKQHPEPTKKFVLIIDQFEELLASEDTEQQNTFIRQLTHLIDMSKRVTLIIVMRTDFYGQFVNLGKGTPEEKTFGQRLNDSKGVINISPMLTRSELEAIIQKPAEKANLRIQDGLVDLLVRETLGEGKQKAPSTVLPLLEFVLARLWENRKDETLTHDAYKQMDGIKGTITSWANAKCDELEEYLPLEHRHLVQRIFTDLVFIGDENQQIPNSRRRKLLTSLCRNEDELPIIQDIVSKLVNDARLLVQDKGMVEIIHDVLRNEWEYLKSWIEAKHTFLTWYQKLSIQAKEWEKTNEKFSAKRARDKLLGKSELAMAIDQYNSHYRDLHSLEREFIKTSQTQQFRMKMLRIIMVLTLLAVLVTPLGVWLFAQARFHILLANVTNLNSDGPGSLRQAIETASPNSIITFADGLTGTIFAPDITIKKNLVISGPGPSVLSITAGNNDNIFNDRIFSVAPHAAVTISSLTLKGGLIELGRVDQLGHGGSSIYNGGSLDLKNCVITGNSFDFYAGGGTIFNDTGATLSISNSIISGNAVTTPDPTSLPSFGDEDKRRGGGGLNNFGTAILTNSTVSDNTVAYGSGGGIFNSGILTIQDSTISHNVVKTNGDIGGGVFNSGTLIMRDSTVSYNTVTNGQGGGIYNSGMLTMEKSTISANTVANGTGGGIYSDNTLSMYDCTISGNIVTHGRGGGIVVAKATNRPDDSISYCTIYNNTATSGGGIVLNGQDVPSVGKVKMEYSILAGNHASRYLDAVGTLFVSGHNLIEDESGATIHIIPEKDSARPLTGVSPKLGPLQNNGGPTQTHAVLPGSPVIGMAPCSLPHGPGLRTDQRGVWNTGGIGNDCTIGSYQPEL